MRLDLRASTLLTLVAALTHCAAAAILWIFLPSPAGALGAVCVAVLAVFAIRNRTLLLGATSPVCLQLGNKSHLIERRRNRTEVECQVSARRYVSRWLVVLELASAPWGHRTILVCRDMLPAGQFRYLRLWALWDALPVAHPPASLARNAR